MSLQWRNERMGSLDSSDGGATRAAELNALAAALSQAVKGELQAGCSQYELLEHLNSRAVAEYNRMADLAVGVRVYVARMAGRMGELQLLVDEFREVERQVGELEETVAALDRVTGELHDRLAAELGRPR